MIELKLSLSKGYSSVVDVWQEEEEVANLEAAVHGWFAEILPLYEELHAFVRHRLEILYGRQLVTETGPIPLHLLGMQCMRAFMKPNTIETVPP